MRHPFFILASSGLLLTACMTACMVESRPGGRVEAVPVLPEVVTVGPDGYFFHNGHHYFYDHDRWYHADSREGARRELPRSNWPRETHRRQE